MAHQTAKNIAAHPAGWTLGYLKAKGWSKTSISQLMRQAFTTLAVIAAEKSKFDKKTGVVQA